MAAREEGVSYHSKGLAVDLSSRTYNATYVCNASTGLSFEASAAGR